ncbi:MAG: hypothetical protein ACOYMP_01050 [Nodosilinea sp.]
MRFEHLLAIRDLLTPDRRQQFPDQRQHRRENPQANQGRPHPARRIHQ